MKKRTKGALTLLITVILAGVFALSITACSDDDGDPVAPTITTTSLPGGEVNEAYSQTLAATGDTSITWSKESGDLPAGLTLAANGTISGTPTTAGRSNFTVKAENSAGSDTKELSIDIGSVDEWPDADRWYSWTSGTAATITHSIGADDVVTITVGGTPESNNNEQGWNAWRATAWYLYTGEANKSYIYKFEAWTESGSRTLHTGYYENNDTNTYLGQDFSITTERKTYTIIGQSLPTGDYTLRFQCADQLGTFYIKIISITENTD